MKIPKYKTYKFGRLIISKINNEITLSYKGKKKIYSKIICAGNLYLKHLIYPGFTFVTISIIVILALSFYYISTNVKLNSNQNQIKNPNNNSAENNIDNSIGKDEKEKNELLLSDKTDYTENVKDKPLRISEYIIKKDDALSGIARKFGVSMDTICGSNNLSSYDFIREGKKLKIPNKDGILHKIEKGQNINTIAKKYKISIEKIYAENNIKNFDFISPGDYVFLPDAKPQNIIPGFLWPVAGQKRITCSFGWRMNPIDGGRQFHQGIDIGCNFQEIRAVKFGRVTYTGWMGGYGNIIIIAHPNGWKSLYGHLSRIYVNKWQSVKQGQSIGRGGNTGYSTGPHLHFELIQFNKPKNPLSYLTYKN
jgi:murein DD-endopeptidase MepM/ murein hydrolase activator NlpD